MDGAQLGLLEVPGAPGGWVWAFTCPTADCGCRTALVLAAPNGREALLGAGQVVAEAWLGDADYPRAARDLAGVTAFAIDLDTREVFPPVGEVSLDPNTDPAVKAVAERLDDDVLDAIARVWYLGKGKQPPAEPGVDGAKIEVEGWRGGDLVVWDDVHPALRGDTYVVGEHLFEVVELYCVEPQCTCGEVLVDFVPVAPRGAPHPGHVELEGTEAMLQPEGKHSRLPELWAAYCQRHRDHRERFARRSAIMHGFAGRIVAATPKPKVGRNERCPCGSGKKFKTCCGGA